MPEIEMENGKRRYWSCKAIIFNNGKMLLLHNNPTGFLLGHKPELGDWDLPGGRMEPGESEEQTLKREIQEELGIEPTVGRFVSDLEFSPRDDVIIRGKCYVCSIPSRNLVLEAKRYDQAIWVTLDEAIERSMPAWALAAINKLREIGDARNYL